MPIPSITQGPFGATGRSVSRVGLGGEGVLRTDERGDEAAAVIRSALHAGVTYFDSARVYASSERYLGSVWGASPAARIGVFQASKTARRDRQGALQELSETLARLQTDYLDLWQIHDLRNAQELEAIAAPGGALEAFVAAREAGRVRAIGVTGHHDPAVLARAVRQWPVDSVMLPVNPVEGVLGGFMDRVLPAALERNLAVIGMKVLGGGHFILLKFGIDAEVLIRYALAQPISVAIVGCGTPGEVESLARAGAAEPLDASACRELESRFAPYARRLAFYRGTFGSH
jgi:aryl-alcohol dehydrogenase-like predicted oxidoreductase